MTRRVQLRVGLREILYRLVVLRPQLPSPRGHPSNQLAVLKQQQTLPVPVPEVVRRRQDAEVRPVEGLVSLQHLLHDIYCETVVLVQDPGTSAMHVAEVRIVLGVGLGHHEGTRDLDHMILCANCSAAQKGATNVAYDEAQVVFGVGLPAGDRLQEAVVKIKC